MDPALLTAEEMLALYERRRLDPVEVLQAVVERIARCVRDAVDEADMNLKQVQAIGIGAPGAIDSETGEVIFAPNLQWKDAPLRKELEKRLEIPVFVYTEYHKGVAAKEPGL